MKVKGLYEYLVKGLRGGEISCASVNIRGLAMDRRWMLVDRNGQFISQRNHPVLTQFTCDFHGGLSIHHLPSSEARNINQEDFIEDIEVVIWGQQCSAHTSKNSINLWLSKLVGEPVRLVYMKDEDIRPINSTEDEIVSFADGYPVLLTSEASLADLNNRLTSPIEMTRFRTNIVIDGLTAFAEDGWQEVQIGPVKFKVAKTCARCQVINIDQEAGISSQEPLRTLATYRTVGNGVNFGVNMIPLSTGIIHKGDEVEIVN